MGTGSATKYLVLWVRIAFGVHALISGANYFLNILPQPPIGASAAGPFVVEMDRIGLYAMIKVVETVVALCLLSNLFVPAALIVEFPITVSIFYLSVVVVGHGRPVYTGCRELFYNGFLLAAYAGCYLPLARPRTQIQPLWRLRAQPWPAGGAESRA